jgi:hypothetical protein
VAHRNARLNAYGRELLARRVIERADQMPHAGGGFAPARRLPPLEAFER